MENFKEKLSEFLNSQIPENYKIAKITIWNKQKSINLDVLLKIKNRFASLEDCEKTHKLILIWAKKENISSKLKISVKSESIDKLLLDSDDFLESVNKKIKIETKEKINNRRNFTGFLKEIKDDTIYLKSEEKLLEFKKNQIKKAVVLI